jgi:hypothetical protein
MIGSVWDLVTSINELRRRFVQVGLIEKSIIDWVERTMFRSGWVLVPIFMRILG